VAFSQRALPDREGALEQGLGPRILAFVLVEPRQVVEREGDRGVAFSQRALPDRERTEEQRLGRRGLPLLLLELGEVVEGGGGEHGFGGLLQDSERPLVKRLRAREIAF